MKKVNLFIVGAAKAGTTSLWRYFSYHPDVFTADDELYKEPSYFTYTWGIKDIDKYHLLFERAKSEKYICDASTAYLTSPESAKLIYDYNPHAKIIAIIRNPIDRAYSLYNWMVMEGYEWSTTFEFALYLENIRFKMNKCLFSQYFWDYMYFRSGLYVDQLDRYRNLFGDNFKVVKFEHMIANPLDVTKDICDFLGIIHLKIHFPSENRSRRSIFPPLTFIARKCGNILSHFSNFSIQRRLINITLSNKKIKPMSEATRLMLTDRYYDSLCHLENKYGLSYLN